MTGQARTHYLPVGGAPLQHDKVLEIENRLFFDGQKKNGSVGSIETPAGIARTMVREALNALSNSALSAVHKIEWLDPCAGTGAFPLAIIEVYSELCPIETCEQLPLLTAVEIDSDAINLLLRRLDVLLARFGISSSEYISSGRLCLENDNFFRFISENNQSDEVPKKFDVLIGNPPYVRASAIEPTVRESIRRHTSSMFSKSADLYALFYACASKLVNDQGALCYITPHNFLKSPSCRTIRKELGHHLDLYSLIDLGERPIFRNVNVHSGIFTFQSRPSSNSSTLVDLSRLIGEFNENELSSCGRIPIKILQSPDSKWVITSSDTTNSIPFETGETLSSCGYTIFSGIRTGYARAYVLSSGEIDAFDLLGDKSVFPLVSATDVGNSFRAEPSRWIINLPKGGEQPSEKILHYLRQFKEQLLERSELPTLNNWYEQRSLNYLEQMKRRKIVFPDIGRTPHFALVESGVLIADGAYFIDTDDLAILAILNSTVARNFVTAHCPTIGSLRARGRLRLKKHVLQRFPLPPRWSPTAASTKKIRRQMEDCLEDSSRSAWMWESIDNQITTMYGLTK